MPSPLPYPLEPVTVSGTTLTVDQYVNQPAVLTRTIAALAAQRFYADKIFRPGPPVTGGAILFERPNPLLTDLYAARRTQEVAPGTQFPILAFERGVPLVATPRKIGGKFGITKEERLRNRFDIIDHAMMQAANTLARDVETMALSEINAVATATSRSTAAAATWASYVAITYNSTTHASQPLSDVIALQTILDLEERGRQADSVIIHPTDWANWVRYYGATGSREALASAGVTNVYPTPRIAAGSPLFFQAGQVGVWSNEFPLDATNWYEQDIEEWFYQWSISPTFAITDQFTFLKLTGV